MSSYNDRIKKRRGKYTDPEKPKQESTTTPAADTEEKETVPQTKKTSYEDRIAERRKKYSDPEVDEEYVNSFLEDAKKYTGSDSTDRSTITFGNSADIYESRKKTGYDLSSRSGAIRTYLEKNKDSLPEEYYKEFKSYLDNFDQWNSGSLYNYYNQDKFYSQWENEEQYNISQMTTEELKARVDKADLEEWRKAYDDMYVLEGPYGLLANDAMPEEERAQHEARYNEILEKYGSSSEEILEKIEQMEDPIAYTTKDGQNVTWQMLYDSRFAAEDLETRYGEYSQAADWEEMSKGIETADDTLSDYNIIFSLQQSMMPYDRETAEASGVDMAQWEETEERRRYIEEKYGVDLHADIYESSKILARLMEQTDPNVPGEKDFFDNLSYLTDEERAVLSYIYNTQGRDAALQWHESREQMYADRQAGILTEVMTAYGQESPFWGSVGSVALGIGGSLEQVSDLLDYVATGEVGHNSFSEASSALRSGTMEEIDLEIGNFDAFDFIYGTTMSGIDSYVNAQLFGPAAEVMLGLGAAAQATKDAKDRGLSDKQAFWTGIASGVFEGVFEHWSIGNFNALKEVASANARDIAKNIAKSMLVNASEETLTEVANILYSNIMHGDFSQYETLVRQYVVNGMTEAEAKRQAALELGGQVLESGASGALMGLGFGTLGSAGPIVGNAMDAIDTTRRTNTVAKGTIATDGGIDALRSLADEMAGVSDTKLQRKLTSQSDRVGKKATTRNVGKLYRNVSAAYSAQDKADITKNLTKNGIAEKTANAIAEAIVDSGNGKIITKKQQDLLTECKDNPAVRTALQEAGAGTFGRAVKMAAFEAGAASGNLKGFADATRTKAAAPGQENKATEGKVLSEEKTSYKVSEDGETHLLFDQEKAVSVKGFASIEDGQVRLQLEDGSTAAAEDVLFGNTGDALIYSTVADMGVSLDTANVLVKAFDPSKGISAPMYALEIQEAYRFGEYNYVAKAAENDPYALVKKQAWNEGRIAAIKSTDSKQAKVEATFQKAKKTLKQEGREVKGDHYAALENGVTVLSLSESQKASYQLADQIAQAAKVDIIVYVGKTGEQGYYDPKTDKIHLNLNAVNKTRQSMMAFTLGHELVHRAKKGSPAKYQAFADFLMEEYGKQGSSVDEMIAQELDAAKEYGIKMTEAEAFEEVVADACQRMLLDTDAGRKLAEFGAQSRKNKSFLEDLKRWIVEFMDKLRKIFKDVEPDSLAAQEFAKFDEGVKQILADMFVDMTVDAGEKLSTIKAVVKENAEAISTDEIITDGAAVTDESGIKYSIKSMKADIAEGQMFEDLKTHCGWTQKQVNELRSSLEDLVAYMTPFRDILDMNETYGREGRRFSPYKPNSDPLYKISMDFSTLCSKRLLTQYVIENLQLRENRPMSAEEQMAIRDMLNEYRKVEKGLQVACAMCYVEAARLKSPKQISKWIADPAEQMKNYFADKNPDFAAFIKEKQGDFKESRGYDRNATKKDMSAKDVRDLNKIRPRVRSQYQLTAEEVQIVERAKALPASTYLTAGNLAELSETDPTIYAAYTAFVRTATRSKSLETDEPYYYGDSRRDNGNGIIVSDSFIEAVNRENGMRFSSWSDWRIQHMLDYITAVIDNSVRGAAMHGYTKFGEEVRVLGKTGMMFNMSGVAGTQTGLNEDGSLSFSPTESIDVNEAIQLREEFPETAGLQCIGVGDDHIRALLRSDIIDYVIPYHVSGLNAGLRAMANIHGWADYTTTQHAAIDKSIRLENTVDKEHWREEPVFSEFFVGYDTGMTGIDAMRASADRYVQMCKDRGLKPKFEQFLKEENYWKLLIDRKMINQKTGKLIRQRAVTPTFDFKTIKGVVNSHVRNYDSGLEARALNHIVENWDSIPKRIRDLKKQGGKKPKKVSKAVDTLANQTLAAQPKGVEDTRKFSLPKTDSDGNQLSEDQVEFFKDSKVRDDQGRLIPMYHGTNNPDFTVFDPQFSDDGISLFFTSDPDVANTYTNLQDKGRDIDPYNLITKDSSAEQFNKAQERVGGGLRVVKITSEWIQEMKSKAEKSATRMFGIANKYADLLEYNNSTGMFSYDIERIREITNKGVDKLKTDDINKLRKAMGDAQQHSFFAKDHKGAEKEIRRIYQDNFKMFDEVWNYKTVASTPDSAIGQYTYTETNSSVPFMIDRSLDFLGHIIPKTEQEAVAKALERMQWADEHHLGNRYKVYLNITNPYILDAGIDYSGKMDIVSLERSTFADGWRVSFENAEHDEIKHMTTPDFMEFVDSAFDPETTAKIKAQIEADNEAYRKEWGDDFYSDLDVDHDIQLRNVNMNYTEAGNWNSLNFNGNENARTRDVTAWAKENGYDGVIFKNMKDAGGYAFMKGRGGSTVATAFSSEQVKSVDNRKPTSNPDIRYSLPKKDSDGNQLSEDQLEFFEDSKVRDENGNLYVLYHGSRSPLFTEFDVEEGVWLTPDQRYAEVYAEMWHSWRGDDEDLTGLEQSVYADPDYRLYKMYANITNPLNLGEINDEFDRRQMNRLARLLGVPASRIRDIAFHDGYQTVGFVYEVTRDKQFIDIAREKGYDGFAATEKGKKTFCAFNAPNQVKLTSNEVPSGFYDIRYSLPKNNNPYSYDALISKPDMVVTTVGGNVPKNRADLVHEAKQNAAKVGKFDPKTGSVSVHVKDIGRDVGIGRDGLKHSLDGGRISVNGPVIAKVGEILSNSIRINELTPREDNIDESYVLIGAARNADNELYVVRSVVNRYTHKLVSVDALYAVNAKKEPAALLPLLTGNPAVGTDSTISIAELLDYVNQYFPDILPEEVLKHYGHDSRPDGKLGPDALYKLPVGEDTSPRALLANAFEGVVQNDIEKRNLREYQSKVDMLNTEEAKLEDLRAEIHELSFAKGKRDTKKIRELQFEANHTANRIATLDKMLLRFEASAPLQNILKREKEMVRKRERERVRAAAETYRKKGVETMEKREAKLKLQKMVLDTAKWISYPKKDDVKCPDLLKAPYADFLNSIDMSSQRLAKGGDPTKNDLKLANAMGSLATALERITMSQDPNQETTTVLDAGYLDLPAGFVQKLRDMTESIKALMVEGEYVINNMTAQEVRQLSQLIRTLNHAIKEMSTLYANLRFANVEALGDDSMHFMDDLGEMGESSSVEDFVEWDNALPYYAFRRFGKGGESVFEGLMDAQDKLAFLAQQIFEFQEKTWTGKEAKAWGEDTHTIDLPSGSKLTLTTADAMSIYCLSRRKQGLQHLLGGGTRVMGIQNGSKKAKDSRSVLSIQDIDAINSSLTDRQKKVAEGIQEFMSTVCSDWGNEISMKRFLTREFNEKNYFPIESNDENLPTKDPSAQQSDLFRLLNISATKPIDPRANNEVIIRNIFDVFTGHASDMARLNAFGLPLLDYMKWLNYREKAVNEEGQIKVTGVRKSMEKAFGKAAKSYVLNLVKDVNGRPSDGGDPSILMKWMRTAKTASVGASLRVATLQITSYPRAALVLSPKSLSLGLTKKPKIEMAKKYCGIALWKSFGFYDTNISRSIEDQMKGVTDVRQKIIELSLKGAEVGDAITWGAMWNACEYEVAATKEYKVGTEEFYQAVGKKLREVVYATQVVDSTLTRSQIMRSKRGMAQEAAAFMSEPTLSANILMDAYFQFDMEERRSGSAKVAWKKTGKYVGNALAVYSIGQLAAALLEGFWDAWRDDDDEEFGKKWWDAFTENLVLDLAPFNKIPIVSDVFEAVLAMFDIGFYSSDKMSTTWLTQAVSAVDAWKEVLGGNSSSTIYNALYKSMRAVSSFLGVSISGVMREGVALWNNTAGAYDSSLKIRTYRNSKSENASNLLDAIIEGDERRIESIKKQFADEEAMESAMRTAIKERYLAGDFDKKTTRNYLIEYGGLDVIEAHWKVDEWDFDKDKESGEEYGKYDDFYEAVKSGTNLKTVIEEYTEHGVELKTLRSQITSHFKPEYLEMSVADRANIKGYLLNAMVACGVDREDAEYDMKEWDFEAENGFAYSDRKTAYLNGEITREQLRSALINFGGYEAEDADAQIQVYELVEMGYDNATISNVKKYNEFCRSAGVPIEDYLQIIEFSNNTENDTDPATGKKIAYSAVKKVMVQINNLAISSAQKTAIALSLWKESTVQKYKLW